MIIHANDIDDLLTGLRYGRLHVESYIYYAWVTHKICYVRPHCIYLRRRSRDPKNEEPKYSYRYLNLNCNGGGGYVTGGSGGE